MLCAVLSELHTHKGIDSMTDPKQEHGTHSSLLTGHHTDRQNSSHRLQYHLDPVNAEAVNKN